MTTTKKSAPTTAPTVNDNKAVFAPLGKYAVAAVIMVSIIVATAIMLDKQLNTVEEQIATIETETAETFTISSNTTYAATINEPVAIVTSTSETTTTQETKEVTKVDVVSSPVAQEILAAPSAEVLAAIEETAVTSPQTEQASNLEIVKTATSMQTRQEQLTGDSQARVEAYKLEQKQRMAEMFARIKSLESQRLDQYKTNQDEQIARLRDQLSSQQQVIEKLILRNKELFEIRAANVRKNQTYREETLNRI